ncbi:MAG: hypothetical protein JRJ35_16835 [Deltaproteobacteria bacterium]|nr:hypothetical protein [Deltaproteobacteria bacterium]
MSLATELKQTARPEGGSKEMYKRRGLVWGLGALMVIMGAFLASNAIAAEVDVYAEGAYTDSDLVVYIYADIPDPILSYGVKVGFDTGDLEVVSAEKNDAVWYFGSGTTTYEYMEPEIDNTAGTVVIIGGKLDTEAPTAGVSGDRILLGKVTFNRLSSNTPSITLDFARDGDFANFVKPTDPPTVLDDQQDGVGFEVTIAERGDANADGDLTNADMFRVKQLLIDNIYRCYADCNASDDLTNADMFCIKNKLQNQ